MFRNILSITLMLFSLSAYAKMEVRIPVSGSAYDNCLLDGGEYRESANYYACCTGPTECVVCEKGAGGSCQLVSASKVNSLGLIKRNAPSSVGNFNAPSPKRPSLRDQMRPSKTRILAPVKAIKPVNKSNALRDRMKQSKIMKSTPAKAVRTGKAPTVKKAVKQYQPLKARALMPNKVISK